MKLKLIHAVARASRALFFLGIVSASVTSTITAQAQVLDGVSSTEALSIKQNIARNVKKNPTLQINESNIDYISKTKLPGIYMLAAKNYSVFAYSDINFEAVILGSYFEGLEKGKLLARSTDTAQRLKKINTLNIDTKSAINYTSGNGLTDLYVFSDINCDKCNLLNKDVLSRLNNVSVHIFPVSSTKNNKDKALRALMCLPAAEQYAAWSRVLGSGDGDKFEDLKAVNKNCESSNALDKNVALSKQLNLMVYPSIIFRNGVVWTGEWKSNFNAEKFIALINENSN